MRKRRGSRFQNLNSVLVGGVLLVVAVAGTYLLFSKDVPFLNPPYELNAAFETANNVQPNSPVRIAGVEAGKVKKVEKKGDGAVVTMEMKDNALPIHKDAEAKVRPRIFLEGNFFIDLKPGTPSAGDIARDGTIPATQTAAPVQLDQVLTSLQSDTRVDLQRLIQGYGASIGGEPEPGEDADQDPDVKGDTAGEALNKSLDFAPGALKGVALVNQALLGTERHDLSKLIAGQQRVSAALAADQENLKGFVTNFNTTMAAFASESENLSETVSLLPDTLKTSSDTFDSLNAAFPPTRAFAREILPGVKQTAETIDLSFPWIAQTRKLVSPDELQGLVAELRPAVADLSDFTDESITLLPKVDLLNRCFIDVLLPTGDIKIEDGFLSTGLENYKEFFQTLAGLSGESQNFDGNGSYTRFQPGGGSNTVSTGTATSGVGRLFGNATNPPIGTRPAMPGRQPPFVRDKNCHEQALPAVNSAKTGAGP
ncbi:MAG: MCE family protein [Thermoleophilaceae bacterium]|nr:MCE family protein [Thermoleophilaceae bacterium]